MGYSFVVFVDYKFFTVVEKAETVGEIVDGDLKVSTQKEWLFYFIK